MNYFRGRGGSLPDFESKGGKFVWYIRVKDVLKIQRQVQGKS